jgi:CubicO group peptidase (beta-lactamase class C family)
LESRVTIAASLFLLGDSSNSHMLTVSEMPSTQVGSLIREHMARYTIPGLSIAIARQGTLLHAAGYGLANLEHNVPATVETIYQTASVGKQFTAALIMLLAERGLVRLDDRIASHFETAPTSWFAITVRHLLTHTSGISDEGLQSLNLRLDYTEAEILERILSSPLEFEPGTRWSYSNSGYVLLGLLIHGLTGRFYGDLLRDWIFTPLGMTTAQVIDESSIIPNRAAGYQLEGAAIRNQEYVSPTLNRTADGALYVTVFDLIKWDHELSSGSLLSRASRESMWSPVLLANGSSYPYGFGWDLESTPRGALAQHDGEWQGFSTHFARYLDDGLTIIILANLAEAPVADLSRAIAQTL